MKTEILQGNSPIAIIEQEGNVSIYKGKRIRKLSSLEQLEAYKNAIKEKVVFILPFSLAGREHSYEYIGEEPILAMEVIEELHVSRELIMSLLPDKKINIKEFTHSISDSDFEKLVVKFKSEIEAGNLCQGIISRDFNLDLGELSDDDIKAIYKKLLLMRGGYMTYMFDTGNDVFMGASPERHITVQDDEVIKNPIAGTMPKKPETFASDLEAFLKNKKEENELSMVTDEELKMIMKITNGGVISGPHLREIGQVIHTEFELRGHKKDSLRAIDCLRDTLYSPTLVGGPLKSAFELITKYEGESRGYYGSAFGVLDGENLDTCIPIRAAKIDKKAGILSVRAGAGIVSDSDPASEVNETTKKAGGFLGILGGNTSANTSRLLDSLSDIEKQKVQSILSVRKANLAKIYLEDNEALNLQVPELVGKRFVLINNGDDFVYMTAYLIEKMGGVCHIVDNSDFDSSKNYDFTLIGPGPGNINDEKDTKMKNILKITKDLRTNGRKIIGICLGHQAICKDMGFNVAHQDKILQGKQEEVNIFGNRETVAFYNSFSPVLYSCQSELDSESGLDEYESYDNNRLLYQKTDNTVSVQFHPESIMTINGFEILKKMILKLL